MQVHRQSGPNRICAQDASNTLTKQTTRRKRINAKCCFHRFALWQPSIWIIHDPSLNPWSFMILLSPHGFVARQDSGNGPWCQRGQRLSRRRVEDTEVERWAIRWTSSGFYDPDFQQRNQWNQCPWGIKKELVKSVDFSRSTQFIFRIFEIISLVPARQFTTFGQILQLSISRPTKKTSAFSIWEGFSQIVCSRWGVKQPLICAVCLYIAGLKLHA